MGKRFGDLEKQAIAILANGGNPATSQDEALRNYWAWKINPSSSAHRLPAASKRTTGRKTRNIFIKPFGVDLPAAIFAQVTISERSNTAASAGVKGACAVTATMGPTDTGMPIKGFVPARVYWRTGEAATSSDRISRITNQPYKSFYAGTDEGYSVPFGQSGSDSLAKRQKDIETALALPNALVTFSPEKYRG